MFYQALEQFKIIDYKIFEQILIPSYLISILVLVIYLFFINFILIIPLNLIVSTKSMVQTLFEAIYFFVLNILKQNIAGRSILYIIPLLILFTFLNKCICLEVLCESLENFFNGRNQNSKDSAKCEAINELLSLQNESFKDLLKLKKTSKINSFDDLLKSKKFTKIMMEISTIEIQHNWNILDYMPIEMVLIHDGTWNEKFGNRSMLKYINDFTFVGDVSIKACYHHNAEMENKAELKKGYIIVDNIRYSFELYLFFTPGQYSAILDNNITLFEKWETGRLKLLVYEPIHIMECFESPFMFPKEATKLYFNLKGERRFSARDHAMLVIYDHGWTRVFSIKPVSANWIIKYNEITQSLKQEKTNLNLFYNLRTFEEKYYERIEISRLMKKMSISEKEDLFKKWESAFKKESFKEGRNMSEEKK